MANYGAMLRRSAERARAHARSTRKALTRFARPGSFACPPDPPSAAARAARNLHAFRFYYSSLLWVLLLVALFPARRAAMVSLMATSKAALLYGVLLKAFPNSQILHRLLRPRLVAAAFVAVVLVELFLADALPQLLEAISIAAPVVLLHAVFRMPGDDHADKAAAEEEGSDDAGEGMALTVAAAAKEKEAPDLEPGTA